MELERRSSGVAKAGLATGITGLSIAALDALGGLAGFTGRTGAPCSEDHFVNRYELEKEQEIAGLKAQLALRDANTYNDQKSLEMYKYFDGKLNEIYKTLGSQEVKNQANADSFKMVSERMGYLKNELKCDIAMERKERKCGDNAIVNYVNATFYPKMVADVTTGTATTAQNLYNPLPAETCGCDCDC